MPSITSLWGVKGGAPPTERAAGWANAAARAQAAVNSSPHAQAIQAVQDAKLRGAALNLVAAQRVAETAREQSVRALEEAKEELRENFKNAEDVRQMVLPVLLHESKHHKKSHVTQQNLHDEINAFMGSMLEALHVEKARRREDNATAERSMHDAIAQRERETARLENEHRETRNRSVAAQGTLASRAYLAELEYDALVELLQASLIEADSVFVHAVQEHNTAVAAHKADVATLADAHTNEVRGVCALEDATYQHGTLACMFRRLPWSVGRAAAASYLLSTFPHARVRVVRGSRVVRRWMS